MGCDFEDAAEEVANKRRGIPRANRVLGMTEFCGGILSQARGSTRGLALAGVKPGPSTSESSCVKLLRRSSVMESELQGA